MLRHVQCEANFLESFHIDDGETGRAKESLNRWNNKTVVKHLMRPR